MVQMPYTARWYRPPSASADSRLGDGGDGGSAIGSSFAGDLDERPDIEASGYPTHTHKGPCMLSAPAPTDAINTAS